MKLKAGIDAKQVRSAYEKAYAKEEFVHLLPEGQMPKTASVLGSNFVAIQVAVDDHTNRLVISVAIDNLVKGAAGQAIQNANIICGLQENLGLTGQGIGA
jgi:N-acetyl-gamma-glutamyl-phosphate reductase